MFTGLANYQALYDRRKKERKKTDATIAKRLHLSRETVSLRRRNPGNWRLDEFDIVCQMLGVPTEKMLRILKGTESDAE